MDNLTIFTKDTIDNYFTKIKNSGYLSTTDTNNLLILSFIEEMLFYKFSGFIDDKDYNILLSVLTKLYGSSCIMQFPVYTFYSELIRDINNKTSRSTEEGYIRFTEDTSVRVAV